MSQFSLSLNESNESTGATRSVVMGNVPALTVRQFCQD
jgi:hypothetical protein